MYEQSLELAIPQTEYRKNQLHSQAEYIKWVVHFHFSDSNFILSLRGEQFRAQLRPEWLNATDRADARRKEDGWVVHRRARASQISKCVCGFQFSVT